MMIILLIFIFLTTNSYAAQPTGIDGLFPDTNTLGIESTQPKLFDKYPITHYMFDSEKFGVFDAWATIFKAITNVLFLLIVFISKGVNYILMACFKLNIFNLISNFFNDIVWSLRDAIFIPLIKPILSIVGIVIIFNAGIGRFTYNWRLIINTILVFAVAFSFFAAPTLFIDMINNFSQDLSSEVLARTATITTGRNITADDAVVYLGNSFWEMTVVKPWQLIQFGDTEIGRREMNNFLSKDPDSESRKKLANAMAKTNSLFRPTGTITRFVMVLFIGFIVLLLNIFIGILAALTAALQFAAIISAIVMVIAFIISLLPNMGFSVALHSLYNTFGFLLGKIGMAILLSMYFAISSVIYGLSSTYGWMMVTLFQLILIVTVILFRKKIFGFVHAVTAGQQAAINNIYKKRDPMSGFIKTGLTLYSGKKVYDQIKDMNTQRKDKKLTKKYTRLAEDYLMQKYTQEKRMAEIEAKRTGKPINYSDFVKRVDARIDKGYTPFDEREINNTVEMMKSLRRQGNDPRNLLTTKIDGVRDEKIKMKQRDLETMIEYEKHDIDFRRRENEEKINRNIKSDKNSKHYSTKEKIKFHVRRAEKEATAAMSEYPIPETFGFGYDEIIISSKNDSGLYAIEKEKEEKAFREMKKQESQQLQEQRKVVNGNNDRPTGKVINMLKMLRKQRTGFKSVTGNTQENANKNEIKSIDNEVLKEAAITKTEINTVNRNSEIKKENKNVEKLKESSVSKLDNVSNESKNEVETVNNEVLKEVETIRTETNTVNRNSEIKKENKNIEKVRESNVINENNITNNKNNRIEINENVINKEKVNKKEITNNINYIKNEEITNKSTENITESNKIETRSVINEQKNVIENTEIVRNKVIENINTKSTKNSIETIYIRTDKENEHRLRRLEEKLDRINKKINKQ